MEDKPSRGFATDENPVFSPATGFLREYLVRPVLFHLT